VTTVAEIIRVAALEPDQLSILLKDEFAHWEVYKAVRGFCLMHNDVLTDYNVGTDTERRMFLLFCAEAMESGPTGGLTG
jgi:hypothetical protein